MRVFHTLAALQLKLSFRLGIQFLVVVRPFFSKRHGDRRTSFGSKHFTEIGRGELIDVFVHLKDGA